MAEEADIELVNAIERVAFRAWPPFETVEYDGWLLRYAGGFSRRSNSVYPAGESTISLDEKLRRCRGWYADRSLELVVRQNPATEQGLDSRLEALGFAEECPTDVMVAPVSAAERVSGPVDESATEEWLRACETLYGIAPGMRPAWRGIMARIEPSTGFAMIRRAGRVVACGFGVVDDGWLGLFEIVVDPQHRRQGLGSRLTESLLAWGRERGAVRSYLQAVADNAPALALYGEFNFTRAYTYWYRRAPAGL